MKWCRCPNCGHKMFMYDEMDGNLKVNIKCSSCKMISDILFAEGKLKSKVKVKTPAVGN